MPMIKPRIRPHRLGSSRKFPRRDCSSETRRSRRPGIRLMRKLQSHANGAVPTAKLWVKVMWDVPVSRLTGAVKTSARMICSTTISRAAVRPYHISPVSCCTSTPAKAACHRLHRSIFSTRVTRQASISRFSSTAPGSTQYRISLFSVTSAAFCQCRLAAPVERE